MAAEDGLWKSFKDPKIILELSGFGGVSCRSHANELNWFVE